MDSSTPSGGKGKRASDPGPSNLDTIIVAPELALDTDEPVMTLRRTHDGTWMAAPPSTPPAAPDPVHAPRAQLLSASRSRPVHTTRTSTPALREEAVSGVWQCLEAALPTLVTSLILGALLGYITLVAPHFRPSAASQLGRSDVGIVARPVPPAVAAPALSGPEGNAPVQRVLDRPDTENTAARVVTPLPSVEALTPVFEPHANSTPRLKLSVSEADVLWGRTERPKRAVRAAFMRSSEKICSCLALTPMDASVLSATLTVAMRIRSSGLVMWARPRSDRDGIAAAMPCIAEALRTTPFPPSQAGLRIDAELTFRTL